MEIDFCFIKYADGEILEAAWVEETKIHSEFKIDHGELKRGLRVGITHMRVVEFKGFHLLSPKS